MALQVVSMEEPRLQVLQEPEHSGDTVAEICRRRGISRETFYLYRATWRRKWPASSRARAGRASRRAGSGPHSRRRSASCVGGIRAGGHGGSGRSCFVPESMPRPS